MWSEDAACRGHHNPDMWFPSSGGLSRWNLEAIQMCRSCPVQQPCLQHAVDTHADGIWGGMTAKERKPLLRPLGRDLVPCGTPGAYRRHQRNGEPVCWLCQSSEIRRAESRRKSRRA